MDLDQQAQPGLILQNQVPHTETKNRAKHRTGSEVK